MAHGHGAGHGGDGDSKYIAIFISILALCLAVAETLAKGAQTNSISYNIEASDKWAFFQAKTIRRTTVETAADQLEIDVKLAKDPTTKAILEKRVADWRATAARYRSEPETQEGSNELMGKAKAAEKKRDLYTEKYHHYEVSSALFQIAIVLASVYLITHVIYMLWVAGTLAALGFVFGFIGLFFPSAVHLL